MIKVTKLTFNQVRKKWGFVLLLVAVLSIGCSLFLRINWTPSMPMGLYVLDRFSEIKKGDVVLTEIPSQVFDKFPNFDDVYPGRQPLLKRLVAIEGDEVCVTEKYVAINAVIVKTNTLARLVPYFELGCSVLKRNEVFFLGDSADSLDSRIYGVSERAMIITKGVYVDVARSLF